MSKGSLLTFDRWDLLGTRVVLVVIALVVGATLLGGGVLVTVAEVAAEAFAHGIVLTDDVEGLV